MITHNLSDADIIGAMFDAVVVYMKRSGAPEREIDEVCHARKRWQGGNMAPDDPQHPPQVVVDTMRITIDKAVGRAITNKRRAKREART